MSSVVIRPFHPKRNFSLKKLLIILLITYIFTKTNVFHTFYYMLTNDIYYYEHVVMKNLLTGLF